MAPMLQTSAASFFVEKEVEPSMTPRCSWPSTQSNSDAFTKHSTPQHSEAVMKIKCSMALLDPVSMLTQDVRQQLLVQQIHFALLLGDALNRNNRGEAPKGF